VRRARGTRIALSHTPVRRCAPPHHHRPQPTIIPNSEGQRTTPSVVAYARNGERLVGQIARRQAVVNPENTFSCVGHTHRIALRAAHGHNTLHAALNSRALNTVLALPSSVKRFIGRKFTEVEAELKEIQYHIKPGDSGNVKIECPQTGRAYAPEEISAEVLRKLAQDATSFLGTDVKRAVITVPGA
jgi:molecular chaperone DnaK